MTDLSKPRDQIVTEATKCSRTRLRPERDSSHKTLQLRTRDDIIEQPLLTLHDDERAVFSSCTHPQRSVAFALTSSPPILHQFGNATNVLEGRLVEMVIECGGKA